MMKPDFYALIAQSHIINPTSPYAFELTEKGPISHGAAGGVVYRLRGLAKNFHRGRGQVSNPVLYPGDVLIFCQSTFMHPDFLPLQRCFFKLLKSLDGIFFLKRCNSYLCPRSCRLCKKRSERPIGSHWLPCVFSDAE